MLATPFHGHAAAQTVTPANLTASANAPPKVQQPKPQALPSRSGPSSILVSPRQKGNPILNSVRSVAWEYSDIPADYVVGATTCALFLSLKYHRLHPEYIYNRIRDLKGQYNLRILLTMVDIESHEEPLKELSKTSLVNNVTVMLCWSAQEAGRYLELFKTFENAAPTSIRAQQSSAYSEKMAEFITTPRSINKTDAVGLVSNFGSVRTAINAGPEEIGLIAGWGDTKVQRWCNAVREPFRTKQTGRRVIGHDIQATMSRDISMTEGDNQMPTETNAETISDMVPVPPTAAARSSADKGSHHLPVENLSGYGLAEVEAALPEADMSRVVVRDKSQTIAQKPPKRKQAEEDLSEGVIAALSKLRKHYLDNTNLKAARASSRKLHDNATPALFRSVVACARYDALGAFQKISLHPVLQNYIKQIVFDGSLYNQDLANSERTYQAQSDRYEALRSSSFWTSRTRWRRYKDLYTEQEDLKASGVLLQTMARALEWATSVSSIVFSPHPRLIPIETKVVRDLIPRDIHGNLTRLLQTGDEDEPSRLDHPFRQLIGAVYLSQYTGIHELLIEAFNEAEPGTPFTFAFFDFPDATDLQAAQFLFKYLERCELNITDGPFHDSTLWFPNSNGLQRLANLSNMLAVANKLRALSLRITGWQLNVGHIPAINQQPGKSMFTRLGLRKTWPELRSLSLEGIHPEKEDILKIITQHKNTLKSITFRKCCLLSGTWADVVDEVVYSTTIYPFTLDLVNETHHTTGQGTPHGVDRMNVWMYEGHVEVLENGERTFVDIVPEKMSVYRSRAI
ncbi:hypothetical protein GQ44DRAFT_736259 [Phaeosphaeriaceae sp. PMI808]|nr:hypothetical protein GQ44DRAFT_736259 [Phaeosphaeriaceae sp. PMI808]